MLRYITTRGMIVALFATTVAISGLALARSVDLEQSSVSFDPAASRAIQQSVWFQGYLADSTTGDPITATYNMVAQIFNASSGGSSVWGPETHVGVVITEGWFNIELGKTVALPAFSSPPYYLQLTVNGEVLTSRLKLASAPMSFTAANADNADKLDGHDYSASWEPDGYNPDNQPGSSTRGEPTRTEIESWGADGYNADNQPGSSTRGEPTRSEIESWGGDGYNSDNQPGYGTRGEPTRDEIEDWGGGESYWTYSSSYLRPNSTSTRVGIGTTSSWGALNVVAVSNYSYGIYGRGNSYPGSAAIFGSVEASNTGTNGILGKARSGASSGVWGWANGASYGVYANGNLGCSGTKSAVVRTSEGPVELYSVESPDLWFEDFGEGRLSRGICDIELDPLFLETVTISEQHPMKVFVQLNDDCNGVYVKRGTSGFQVVELGGGASDAAFSYRILARRKGYETQRMKVVETCYYDRDLYPSDNDPAIPADWQAKRMEETERMPD